MTLEINCLVANIVDAYRVTLTCGNDDGVELDSRVTIWRAVKVENPLTGEDLGSMRVDNVKMRVSEVYSKFSVAVVPRETSSLFPSMPFVLPRKQIADGDSDGDGTRVFVRVGDEATVFVEPDS